MVPAFAKHRKWSGDTSHAASGARARATQNSPRGKRAARVSRHGPAGTGRCLYSDQIRAQPAADRRPLCLNSARHARRAWRAAAVCLWREPIEAASISLPRTPECADLRLRAWRRVASGRGQKLCVSGRAVCGCRRALRRARLRQRARYGRRPDADRRPGPPRNRLGFYQRVEFRRRSAAGSTCSVIPRARILRASPSLPTGRGSLVCRRTR